MKAFFGKIWAWVLANKILAGIIAGGTAVVLAVAIAVPCGVSAAKKKKAAQEETHETTPSGGENGGQQSGGGNQQGGDSAHTHNWATAWSHDATNHWHACEGCTEKNDVEAHKFGAWTIVSETKEERTCSTCGYKEERAHTHTLTATRNCNGRSTAAKSQTTVSFSGRRDSAATQARPHRSTERRCRSTWMLC